jgi:hypothetical protein
MSRILSNEEIENITQPPPKKEEQSKNASLPLARLGVKNFAGAS